MAGCLYFYPNVIRIPLALKGSLAPVVMQVAGRIIYNHSVGSLSKKFTRSLPACQPQAFVLSARTRMTPNTFELQYLMEELSVLLMLPETNFYLSHWNNAAEAKAEIQSYLSEVAAGNSAHLFQLRLLFAPGGPLQEVSLSSGWGDLFFDLAERLEAAIQGSSRP